MKWVYYLEGALLLFTVAVYYQPLGKAIRSGFPVEAPVDIPLPLISSSVVEQPCDCEAITRESNLHSNNNNKVEYISTAPDHNRLQVLKCLRECHVVKAEYACHSVHDQPNHLFREFIRQLDTYEFVRKLLCLLGTLSVGHEKAMLTIILNTLGPGVFIIRDCPLHVENKLWVALRDMDDIPPCQKLIWVTLSIAQVEWSNVKWDGVAVRRTADAQQVTAAESKAIFKWMRGREITEAETLFLSVMNSYTGTRYPIWSVVPIANSITHSLLKEKVGYGPFLDEYILGDRYFQSLVSAMMTDVLWRCTCFTDEKIVEFYSFAYAHSMEYLSFHLCCGWKLTCGNGSCVVGTGGMKHYNMTSVYVPNRIRM